MNKQPLEDDFFKVALIESIANKDIESCIKIANRSGNMDAVVVFKRFYSWSPDAIGGDFWECVTDMLRYCASVHWRDINC
jgi:hypothetical protein